MNKETILKILEEKIITSSLTNEVKGSNLEWKTQDSNDSSILFYKIQDGKQDEFWERIKNCQFAIIIINKEVSNISKLKNYIIVKNDEWLECQKLLSDHIYPWPNSSLKFVGITGTNGKTTTTDLIRQLAIEQGIKVVSIGTLGVKKNHEQILPEGLTTPAYIDLRKIIFQCGKDIEWVVMEVSSHSLIQERIYKIKFDIVAWTSFSQDHLDFHGSIENYFQAKCLLIEKYLKTNAPVLVPSYEEELFSKLRNYPQVAKTMALLERKVMNLPLFFLSHFNKSNLEVAWDIMEWLTKKKIQPDLYKLEMTKGRFSIFNHQEKIIIIDFAHTPDAIMNICQATRQAFPNTQIHLVFGCGGDRDKSKRPLMAQAAESGADVIYVTSDNPRFENPEDIIHDITRGFSLQKHRVKVKRQEAIAEAFEQMKGGDVLIIAGKGHENYQIFKDQKIPYSDQAVIDDLINKRL